MRILFIGGTRFMGLAATRELLAGGHTVAVYHRGESEADVPAGATHLHGDRAALAEARPPFEQFAPEVVVHMMAMTEADAHTFVETFRGLAQRAVVISSQDVYRAFGRVNGKESGEPDPLPLTEDSALRTQLYPYRQDPPRAADDPARWMDEYDKILVERAVMSDPALPTCVLRMPAIYGPHDGQHRFAAYLRRMDDGREVIALDEAEAGWRWTHAYVDDVAHAIALAALDARSAGHIYHVGEQRTLSLAERVAAVAEAAGWHGRVRLVPAVRLPEPVRMGVNTEQDVVVDSSRIRRDLGYAEVTPIAETYARAVAWERAHPAPRDAGASAQEYAAEDAALAELA